MRLTNYKPELICPLIDPQDTSETPDPERPIEEPPTQDATFAQSSNAADEMTREWTTGGDADDSDGQFDFVSADHPPEMDVPEQLGDYRVQQLIGSGGMGQVFLAEHGRMQRIVALKTLPKARLTDDRAIDRFFAEVRAASKVLHPNIVTAFDAGEQDGIPYLAMEYVDGATLTAIVSQSGPLSVGEAASVIRQAALGLLHAHRAGLVHRDVKPGNLMRAQDGTIKVLDLGLARIGTLSINDSKRKSSRKSRDASIDDNADASNNSASADTSGDKTRKKGKLIGTLSFMSPEQLEDPEDVDSRSDIYSLGATLFFLLMARPPFSGEFLDLVYGHRHGEIPDLMQLRDDVDLTFANVFQRMLAKSPSERYNSLDEVIDDLAPYADNTSTPNWLSELTRTSTTSESTFGGGSTFGGESTVIRRTEVVGLDVGMFHTAAASCDIDGELRDLLAGEDGAPLFRMILSSDEAGLHFGPVANEKRADRPDQVVHCVPMYIGQTIVERDVAGRQCPPEVLLGAMIRRCLHLSWRRKIPPDAVAVTVPSIYDQMHRRSILQATMIAGVKSVRLVDRSLAATQSLLKGAANVEIPGDDLLDDENGLDPGVHRNILYVSLTGQASECAVIRHDLGRLQQLGTSGHWKLGTLAWTQRLVDIAAEKFQATLGVDPRQSLRRSARLQIACERATQTLAMLPSAQVQIVAAGQNVSVEVTREAWLTRCEDLLSDVRNNVELACKRSGIESSQIDVCVLLGPLLNAAALKRRVLSGLRKDISIRRVDRNDVACGAATCLAAELPGRGDIAMPPRNVSAHQIGILAEDGHGRRRIMPLISRGTILPARTNRRISSSADKPTLSLSLVESSGPTGEDWQSLGRYDFEGSTDPDGVSLARMIGFEIDVNGLLSVRAQTPGVAGSVKLGSLPKPAIDEADMPGWIEWLNEQPVN